MSQLELFRLPRWSRRYQRESRGKRVGGAGAVAAKNTNGALLVPHARMTFADSLKAQMTPGHFCCELRPQLDWTTGNTMDGVRSEINERDQQRCCAQNVGQEGRPHTSFIGSEQAPGEF